MKKLVMLIMCAVLGMSLVACGAKEEPKPNPDTNNGDVVQNNDNQNGDNQEQPSGNVASNGDGTYTLDYDSIASWATDAMLGSTATDAPALILLSANRDQAAVIFGDNTTMQAASFVGAYTIIDEAAGMYSVTDSANNLSLTFKVFEEADGSYSLDLGNIGTAVVAPATIDDGLASLKAAIENYEHIA